MSRRDANSITISGVLGKDPERKGEKMVSLRVANNRWLFNAEHTNWIDVFCFGKVADNAEKYLKKGSPVMVTGEYNKTEKTGKDGVRRFFDQILCKELVFLPGEKKEKKESEDDPFGGVDVPDFSDDIPL